MAFLAKNKLRELTPEEIRVSSRSIAIEHTGTVKEITFKKEIGPEALTIIYFQKSDNQWLAPLFKLFQIKVYKAQWAHFKKLA